MSNSIQLTRFPNGTVTAKAEGNPALFFLGVCIGAYVTYRVIKYVSTQQIEVPKSVPQKFLETLLEVA